MTDNMTDKLSLDGKHIIAIDYGRKFTGIATYKYKNDPYPLRWGRVAYQDDNQLLAAISQIIKDEFIDIVVLGIPYYTDGNESEMTKTVKKFSHLCSASLIQPVFEVDEALTTFEAEERMKADPQFNFKVDLKQIDAVSATIILEQFVNSSSD